jgi:hypothetical protein
MIFNMFIVQASLTIITYDCNLQFLICLKYRYHLQSSLMIVIHSRKYVYSTGITYNHHLRLSFTVINMFKVQASDMIITYDCQS